MTKELIRIICVSTLEGQPALARKESGVPRRWTATQEDIQKAMVTEYDGGIFKKRYDIKYNPICQLNTSSLYFSRACFIDRSDPERSAKTCEFENTPEYDDGYEYNNVGRLHGWYELYKYITDLIANIRCKKKQDIGYFAEYITHITLEFNDGTRIKFYNGFWFYG